MFWDSVNAHQRTPFTNDGINFIGRVTVALMPYTKGPAC
jgi:hypothetical protein